MPESSTITTQTIHSTSVPSISIDISNIVGNFYTNLHSYIYNQYFQSLKYRSGLINILCNILTIQNIDKTNFLFILDCLITNYQHIADIQF
ncbi:unnamed protein product [Rotaria sp. Silwood1]|nr:unnamed protein product [Rotaria sp. Silwood1]